ncbi:MAG: tetratricopeptide repeat protein [Bacteroidota bacterium]|jgi:Flp pilus assembly protein TadD/outer membrane protein OmpA-like peptidoglycan-associated protein
MIKINHLKLIVLAAGTTIFLTSCDGLGKMIKKQNLISYEIKPNPLEMHADSVNVTITGKYPPKLFAKKAAVTVTPVITYNGGEISLKPVVLVGEKSTASGQKISYSNGGSFSYTDKVAFKPEIKVAKLAIKASGQIKTKKPKDFKPTEIGDGTTATPLLARNDEKGVFAKDNFVKSVSMNQSANIYYELNNSNVRSSELKTDEVKKMLDFIATNQNNTMWYDFKGVEVSGFASPDGKLDRNGELTGERTEAGKKALENQLNPKSKKKTDLPAITISPKKPSVDEDWEGFKSLIQASNMKDKELVVRVLSMFNDPEQREKEISNMAETYKEIKDKIMPKLRRSVLTLLVDKKSRTDEMISKLMVSTPDSLSIEELIYGANLTNDINTKANVYRSAEKKYPNEWRASSNYGVVLLMQNKVSDAKSAFERAAKIAPNEPIVNNGLGIIAAKEGNREKAMEYYKKSKSAGPEVEYNMGILNIRNGKYDEAVRNFGNFKGANLALATLLSGKPEAVAGIIDASNEKESALSFYIKAVAAARKGDKSAGISSLKSAIEKDGSYKQIAKEDAEFLKWKADADFTSIVQ